ncbi:MAG: hypothetical protein BGN87_06210 [Rhizobiales bacterium 65-79]|nr:hypothetical protein [Hyphomicrobiales bacterium]OJU02786.1 MAG: hypothetical protein BGN87_06210 [Rhizobiales bacterium 65-79]
MALKLALVIDGDAGGAKKAVEQTGEAIDQLAEKAKGAGEALKDVTIKEGKDGNPWEGVGKGLDDIKSKAPPAADALDKVGDGLGKTNTEAPGAATGILSVGKAADTAGGKLAGLSHLAATAIGGLIGGLTATAVGALFGALVQGVISYATTAGDKLPTLNQDLKEHTALIKQIKGAFDDGKNAASSYGNVSATLLRFQEQQNIQRLRTDLENGAPRIGVLRTGGLGAGQQVTSQSDVAFGFTADQLKPFMDAVGKLRKDLQDGKADYIAFRNEVAQTAQQLPADSPARKVAEGVLDQTEKLAKAQEELQRAVDLYKGLTGDADAAAKALGGTADKFQQVNDTVSGGLGFLQEYDALLKSIGGGSAAPVAPGNIPDASYAQPFAAGGWTGPGPVTAPAGVVHGQEYVFDAASTARIGVANLDAMRRGVRGYASGGLVGTYAVTSATAAGGSSDSGLSETFSLLRGSLMTFGHDLARTHNLMDALNLAAEQLEGRLIDFGFKLISNAFLGSGKGDFGLLGSLFGLGGGGDPWAGLRVATGHTGATIGRAAAMRTVSPAVFLGAPSFHGGGTLRPGEVPFIGKEGEEIGWPDQLAAKYGSRTVVQVVDNAGVEKRTRKTRGPNGEEIVQVLLDRVKADYADGGFDDMNRALYGIGRNGVPA